MTSALHQLSLIEQATAIATGEVSSRELVAAHIARCEELQPKLNALTTPLFEQARAQAAAADERQARGEPLGPLHGVPISIKECFDITGTPSTMGLPTLVNKLATADNPLVERVRAAGGVVIGKTNVPQLMMMYETINPIYGQTNNPWNVERTCGGSSGGEAALIAAGGSAGGVGSDIGGSIRVPAHFCGITGLKPSSYRLPKRRTVGGLHGLETIQWQPGPLARRVDDLDLLMSVLHVEEPHNFECPPVPLRSSRDVSIKGLRVAYWESNDFFVSAPAVRRAVREAVQHLADQGAIVEPWPPPKIRDAMFLYTATFGADGGACSERLLRGNLIDKRVANLLVGGRIPERMRGVVAWMMERTGSRFQAGLLRNARRRSADEYWQLTAKVYQFRREFCERFAARYDALVLPPFALPAPRHGYCVDLIPAASDTLLINLLGMPSGVVPVTTVQQGEESDRPISRDRAARAALLAEQDSAGLPVGVQVVSHFWREDIVLATLRAIERGVNKIFTPV